MDAMSRIIWSADAKDEKELTGFLDKMPELRIVKIDRAFVTMFGLGVMDRIRDRGLQIFDDAKIVEIPSKVVLIAEMHLKYRPYMLNCMAGALSSGIYEHDDLNKIDGLKRFADVCHAAGTKPCGVTVLTSKEPDIVESEFNRTPVEQVLYYVEKLLNCGFTDVVCSPRELQAIRNEKRFDGLDLNTPGIRPLGSAKGDQARSDTPESAILAGATRLVIGRPITVGDPAENLRKIAASIAGVL